MGAPENTVYLYSILVASQLTKKADRKILNNVPNSTGKTAKKAHWSRASTTSDLVIYCWCLDGAQDSEPGPKNNQCWKCQYYSVKLKPILIERKAIEWPENPKKAQANERPPRRCQQERHKFI
ncbi:hypothetical protein [Marinobacter sp. NFXS9]|uniref:hypothetical protein n=1 Tax=Marinobacter sp. NFXS9 TaxID=2818433 RepID=UPI0032DEBC35